jgi:hypothetical protein
MTSILGNDEIQNTFEVPTENAEQDVYDIPPTEPDVVVKMLSYRFLELTGAMVKFDVDTSEHKLRYPLSDTHRLQ